MSDVRIENVGGPRPSAGVASEATLQELVRVLNRSGQSNTASQLNQRYQKDYNRSVNETTRAKGTLRQAAINLTKEFVTGGDRLSDFSEHIFKTNGIIQRLIRFSDGLVDQFREFSSVGASFNNNIFDMRTSALQAAMNLDSFQQLVMNNSDTLRLFGSSVTDGTKRFTQLSRQFRNINPQFFNMGFTIEDINEGLMNYTELLAKTGRVEQINSSDMLDGSAAYMKQLDMLAKATGQSREALARQSEDINNDARMRAIVARAGGKNADALAQHAATVMAFAPGLRDSFLNLMDGGVAFDEISQLLGSAAGTAGQELMELFQNARNLEPDEFARRFAELGPEVAQFINSELGRELVATEPAFREFADAFAPMARVTYAQVEANREEQAQTELVTSTLAEFSHTIQELKSFIVNEIIESEAFSALGRLGESFKNLLNPDEEGSVPNFQGTLTRAINALVGEDGIITKAITWVDNLINSDNFSVKLTEFVNTLTNMTGRIVDFFLGAEQELPNGQKERIGGIFANLNTMFNDLFSQEREGESLWTTISNSVQKKILSWLEGGEITDTNNFWNRAWTAVGDKILNLLNIERSVKTLEIDTPAGLQNVEVPATFWQTIYDTILERLGLEQAEGEEGESPWTTISNSVQEKILSWLEGGEITDTNNFWNRAWTAVGDRILNSLNIERSFKTLEIGAEDGLQNVEVPATFWQTIYDTILERLGLEQAEGEEKSLLERIGDKFSTAFENFLQGETGQRLINTVTSLFEELLDNLFIALSNIIPGYDAEGPKTKQLLRSVSRGQELTEDQVEFREELVGTDRAQIDNIIQQLVHAGELNDYFSNQLTEHLSSMSKFFSEEEMTDERNRIIQAREDYIARQLEFIEELENQLKETTFEDRGGIFGLGASTAEEQKAELEGQIAEIRARLANLQPLSFPTPPEVKSIGTLQATGMRAEPRDTVAQIHQGERVLNPQETQAYNNQSGDNQRDLLQKLDQLNNTMMTVASLINQELLIQTRTMNSISGLGPDLMKGMPG